MKVQVGGGMVAKAATRRSGSIAKINRNRKRAFDVRVFLDSAGVARTIAQYRRSQKIFSQGDSATSVMYIQKGGVKLSVVSPAGKEAIVALLGPGDFFAEGCLAGLPFRMGSATAITPTTVLVIEKKRNDSRSS
jgi:CRP/FNR family transcriptional regulator, cyclic AMP receptor protein